MELSDFSPSQREVVTACDGPLSVLAGPGSGKTTVLAGRIAYLVEQRGVSPSTIMAIAFTTAAAATLRQRLVGVLGTAAQDLTITTFHALGLRIVKQWSRELGFGQRAPAVYSRDDARVLLREAAADFGINVAIEAPGADVDPWSMPVAKLAFAIDRYRLASGSGARTQFKDDDIDAELLEQLSDAYEERLQRTGAVDYAAMLTLPLRLFASEPRALGLMQTAYRFVMADEFQDTSLTQFKLLEQIVQIHHNLAVVGDPNQAVYMWTGADPDLLMQFPRQYPEARVFPLEQNHRSTRVVVDLSNALAAPLNTGLKSWTTNADGPAARLYEALDESDEARYVAAEIRRLIDDRQVEHPGQVAVLYRTNLQARIVSLHLRAAGLPFRVRSETDLFVRPEIRDLVAYLRLAHCPTDGPAMARVINTPPRRLGVIEQALRRRPVPVTELAAWAHKRAGPSARRAVERFVAFVTDLHRDTQGAQPCEVLETILERTGYCAWLEAEKDGRRNRLQAVDDLRTIMRVSAAPDLGTWLIDMHLGQLDGPPDAASNAVTLTTIHSAKGAEWPVVFVIGLEEGLLPHGRPSGAGEAQRLESEERRLAYVALSRTQVLLYLIYCRVRRLLVHGGPGRLAPRQPSRFLLGLPSALIERVDDGRAA